MSNIPTAEEFLKQSKALHDMWDNTRGKGEWDEKAIAQSHIEFAKLHVEEVINEVYLILSRGDNPKYILNAYSLTNIK